MRLKQSKKATPASRVPKVLISMSLEPVGKSSDSLISVVKSKANPCRGRSQFKLATVTFPNCEESIPNNLLDGYELVVEFAINVDKIWLVDIRKAPYPCLERAFDNYQVVSPILLEVMFR